jgi:CubicO group peptidase (beta-lactamase class C family)
MNRASSLLLGLRFPLARALAIVVLGVSGALAGEVPLDERAIDAFVREQISANGIPGAALAITKSGRIVLAKGYGSAGTGRPVTAQTQFMIASLSKSFTAIAVMQLVEAGKINLDAPVQSYLPAFELADRIAASRITVRHLLNQTSGLADQGFPEMRLAQPLTIEERVKTLRVARPVSTPGMVFHYFNPNYAILARLVEVVSGMPFADYMTQRIFAPLGMNRTFAAVTSREIERRAEQLTQGHIAAFGIPIRSTEMDGYLAGSGGVVSNAEDMARYLAMQTGGDSVQSQQILSPASLRLTHEPPTSSTPYAMGWFATTINGRSASEHNGVLSTVFAEAVLLPEQGYGIVILYDVYSLPAALIAFPNIKSGLIALLEGRKPEQSVVTVRQLGFVTAMLTFVGFILCLRMLWHQIYRRTPATPVRAPWTILRIAALVTPGIVLVCLPWLIEMSSGRAFSFIMLFQGMLDLTIGLAVCGTLLIISAAIKATRAIRSASGHA